MRSARYRIPLAILSIALLGAIVIVPRGMAALHRVPAADFAPPMTISAAREVVAAAQQADIVRRAALAPERTAQDAAALPMVQNMFFAQTSYHVSDRAGFLNFWRENGGVLIFGYPISEEMIEDGRIVQYFERARFEYHPENLGGEGQVMLSLLGHELNASRKFAEGTPTEGRQYFPETKHTLGGKFLRFWQKRGGLAIFGYPISEPLEEVSPVDGVTRTVQYFERARFEYHPEALDDFYRQMESYNGVTLAALQEIQMSDLGRHAAEKRGYTFATSTQMPGTQGWDPTLWARRIEVNLTAQYLTAYEGDVPVYRAPVATGKDGFNTPTGTYAIYTRYSMQTMTGSGGGETWYVPNIPWVQYVVGGVALHGTYWHDQWGTGARMSHGCINLNIDDAQWLYEWADVGTQVDIHY